MVGVLFQPSGRRGDVPAGSTLLEAARAAGVPLARACGAEGLCGRCAVRILSGATHVDDEAPAERLVRRRNRVEDGLRLACATRVSGDVVVTASYW